MKLDLIDNAIPAAAIEEIDDTKSLSVETLDRLASVSDIWSEPSLRSLVKEVVEERDSLDVRGYTNPEFFFSDQERIENIESGMVLLDWDTGMDGVDALKETIQSRPNDGIFIITGFDTALNVSEQVGEHFADSAQRIVVCRKGESGFSLLRMISQFYQMVEAGIIVGRKILTDRGPDGPQGDSGMVHVWYGTNRKLVQETPVTYGTDREQSLHYGRAQVRVERRAGIASQKKLASRFFSLAPRRTTYIGADPFPEGSFFDTLGSLLRDEGNGESEVLLFVHGFNVPFESAVESIAQIGFDIRFQGQLAAFSWPSLGDRTKHGYMADKETALASTDLLGKFLLALVGRPEMTRLHIVAHSMGNFALLHSLDRVLLTHAEVLKGRLGELVLVAADVEAAWFLEREFSHVTARTTVYTSSRDWALTLAYEYQQHPRLGLIPPVTCGKNCETVDASTCKTPFSGAGHDYYAESTRLLADFTLVLQGLPAQKRPAMEPRKLDTDIYWALQPIE